MATDKTDLPGASVTVNIPGGSDAPFVYKPGSPGECSAKYTYSSQTMTSINITMYARSAAR